MTTNKPPDNDPPPPPPARTPEDMFRARLAAATIQCRDCSKVFTLAELGVSLTMSSVYTFTCLNPECPTNAKPKV